MSFLENLDWRYAVKSFDIDKKITKEKLQKILYSIEMTPTSFGLEPYRVDVIENSEDLKKIQGFSFNQAQVGNCSHLLVFSARTDIMDRIDAYLQLASGGDKEVLKTLEGYGDVMRGFVQSQSSEEILVWAKNQVHIALGFALAACAELRVDSCAIGGFLPDKIQEFLKLDEKFIPTVLLPIGFRVENPKSKKVRFGLDDL
ncbi:TPA: NAD(P)H-dependent oxidoreductase [Candidatus Gracilibacteria bacterium]|nr:NAD(P)H-dependent oxidoreductase [Candidatus Gracilibacteria bacterium]